MSSHKIPQNNSYINETWSHNFNGEEDMPRPPNPATESRILSRFLVKHENDDQDSEPNREDTLLDTDARNTSSSGNQSSQTSSSQKSQQPLTLPEVHSVLSADAQEFIPRSKVAFVSSTYPGQEQSQNDAFSLSVTAAEFVPRVPDEYRDFTCPYYPKNFEQCPSYLLEGVNTLTVNGQSDPLCSYGVSARSIANPILERFNQALHILNMHPGNIEEYLRPICKMINSCSDATEIVNDLVESLFNQSLQETNFRYTGARIVQFLNTSLKCCPHFSDFIKIFVERCLKEYDRREELKNGSLADQERLIGLAMLMAEIFLNVETDAADGTIQRLQFLPSILVDFVMTFLTTPSDLNVKCSCQLLKLSGGLIEDVVKNSVEECMKFEAIFTQLESLQSNPKLAVNTKSMIDSVIKLKECDWNRSSYSPNKKTVCLYPSEPNNFQAPEPVFYNQMGTPCTRTEAGFTEEDSEEAAYVLNEEEEAAYLAWQTEQEGLTDDQGISVINDTGYDSFQLGEVVDDGGMGDEMEAAYEEFLQKQSYLQGYLPQMSILPEQQIHSPVHPMFIHPPPILPPHQEFNGYQQQPMIPPNQQPMIPPNQQRDQMQQQHQDQQQQYQTQFTNSDYYHYKRL